MTPRATMRLCAVGLVVLLASACGDAKPPQRTVFDPQVQAPKKARAVGEQVDQAARQQREQIEGEVGSEK